MPRTVCTCRRCSICCEHIPGTLAPRDLPAIAAHLGYADSTTFASNCLSVGTGPTLRLHDGRVLTLPKLVPRRNASGACIFYKEGRCSIHAVSPFGCSHFDAHMSDAEADRRSESLHGALLADHLANGRYSQTVKEMRTLGQIAPPAELNRAALLAAMRRESLL